MVGGSVHVIAICTSRIKICTTRDRSPWSGTVDQPQRHTALKGGKFRPRQCQGSTRGRPSRQRRALHLPHRHPPRCRAPTKQHAGGSSSGCDGAQGRGPCCVRQPEEVAGGVGCSGLRSTAARAMGSDCRWQRGRPDTATPASHRRLTARQQGLGTEGTRAKTSQQEAKG